MRRLFVHSRCLTRDAGIYRYVLELKPEHRTEYLKRVNGMAAKAGWEIVGTIENDLEGENCDSVDDALTVILSCVGVQRGKWPHTLSDRVLVAHDINADFVVYEHRNRPV